MSLKNGKQKYWLCGIICAVCFGIGDWLLGYVDPGIARPFATFEPVSDGVHIWTVGSTFSYRFQLFGVISFGTHTIHILRFDPDGVSSREGNERVPVWNHDIVLEPIDAHHTRYSDRVEIKVGWKTVFVWLWANALNGSNFCKRTRWRNAGYDNS